MLLQTGEAGEVALGPTGREVLDRSLLIGHEDDYVHAGDLAVGRPRVALRAGARASGGDTATEQDPARPGGCRLQQIATRDPCLSRFGLGIFHPASFHFMSPAHGSSLS